MIHLPCRLVPVANARLGMVSIDFLLLLDQCLVYHTVGQNSVTVYHSASSTDKPLVAVILSHSITGWPVQWR
jgi:hypothetical protein